MKFARALSICTLLLWFATSASALNPDRDIYQLAHRSWGEKEGYPGRSEALAQTPDGFLWIGSDFGLFRFDGVRFERYVARSGDKLPEALVRSVLPLPDGSLWIAYGYVNKICVLRNGTVKSYGKADGVISRPDSIVQDREGTVWANTDTGVIRFNGTRWERIGKEWNFPEDVPHITSNALFVDSHGTLWAGVNHTVLYLRQGSKQFEPTGVFAGWSQSFAEAPDGTIWMADNEGYVRAISTSVSAKATATARCEVETPKGIPPKCPSEDPQVVKIRTANTLLFDRNGSLWMGTDISGVGRIPHPERLKDGPISATSDELERFTEKDGLSADNCDPILEDREGNIWVATRDGLDQFRDTALVPVAMPTSTVMPTIAPADGGDIWVSGTWNYVARIHGDSRNVAPFPADASKLYRDRAGVTWLAGNSLWQWKDGRFRKVAASPDGLPSSFGAWQVASDNLGTLWAFSNGRGFFSLDHNRWRAWATPPQFAKFHILDIFSGSTGRIWVSTHEGDIVTMDKGTVVDYPVEPNSPLGFANTFAEHAPQEIWAGGTGGLVLIDRGRFRQIKSETVGSLKNVVGIVDAGNEGLWLYTTVGIIHVSKDELDRALRSPSYRFQAERFDSSDGLPGHTEAFGPYPKAIEGTDGRIWFTGTRGVAWIDPKKNIPRNTLAPPVSITSVSADDSPQLQLADLRLPARTANVQINYTALSLTVPERVRFKYKLDGIDKEWKNAGTRREAFYTNLGPRHYRFRVIACNNDGIWNNVGAVVGFTIEPAWYETTWFYIFCVAAVCFLVWVLYQLRVRQIAKSMSDRFDERLSERTRIARDFHDTLLQTIHGTKLVADSALKHSTDPIRMRSAMEQVSIWMGQATEEGRTALNSLRTSTTETNDLAEAFRRSIEECRIHSSMEASFSVLGEVSEMHPIVRDEVYRIGYEAIRNACVHSQAAQLQVELTYADDLILRVNDNGVGIDPAIVSEGRQGHFGLQGMRERASRILAKLTVETCTPSGTEIKLIVPGSIIYRSATSRQRKLRAIKLLIKRMGLTSD
jgi:signal transduction histidine kinase/ligand-binding sensor domain-containing protein